jgi:Cupin-like domain
MVDRVLVAPKHRALPRRGVPMHKGAANEPAVATGLPPSRGHTGALPGDWRRWITENKLLGRNDEQLLLVLQKNGFAPEDAARDIAEIKGEIISNPLLEAGLHVADKLRKLESLLAIHEELARLTPLAQTVEVRRSVLWNEFLCNYYALNQPLVLSGIMRKWKALTLWNPLYLRKVCGDQMVEVMAGRDSDPGYEINSSRHKKQLLFADYIDLITKSGETNDVYMTANNHFLEQPGAQPLLEDIVAFPEYLDPERLHGHTFLWFGPAGTVTPLHHDLYNILYAQVYGRKSITLISPNQTPLLYNEIGVFSEVDCANPDLDKFPAFRNVRKLDLVLHPGQVLFIPVGWWHYVKALDISISISFTNFKAPNSYRWDHPVKRLRTSTYSAASAS